MKKIKKKVKIHKKNIRILKKKKIPSLPWKNTSKKKKFEKIDLNLFPEIYIRIPWLKNPKKTRFYGEIQRKKKMDR